MRPIHFRVAAAALILGGSAYSGLRFSRETRPLTRLTISLTDQALDKRGIAAFTPDRAPKSVALRQEAAAENSRPDITFTVPLGNEAKASQWLASASPKRIRLLFKPAAAKTILEFKKHFMGSKNLLEFMNKAVPPTPGTTTSGHIRLHSAVREIRKIFRLPAEPLGTSEIKAGRIGQLTEIEIAVIRCLFQDSPMGMPVTKIGKILQLSTDVVNDAVRGLLDKEFIFRRFSRFFLNSSGVSIAERHQRSA